MSSSVSLTHAVTSGDERAVTALLAKGADVNETTSGGQTAILAVIFGHTNLVRLLVKAGANPGLKDNLGLNAIDWAQRKGSTEALAILTNPAKANAAPQPTPVENKAPLPEPPPPPSEVKTHDKAVEAERSSKWVAGLKQRLDEQTVRRLNRNEATPELRQAKVEPPPPVAPEPPSPHVETLAPAKTAPVVTTERFTGRVITPSPKAPSPTGKRKRCPKCNAIYNGELVSYCAHHIVPLVDADEPIITTPPKSNVPMFWVMVVITLTRSIVVGSLITAYLYKANTAAARSAAAQQANVQKGFPEVGGDLAGKALNLPEAECPLGGSEPQSGTVTVRIMVDKNGQVYWARGSGGDWLMRGASTEAAMKSTFAPEKLRGRETEGTITYTFKP